MDYMTELATDVFPWFTLDRSDTNDRRVYDKIDIVTALEQAITEDIAAEKVWAQGSDQGRLELLVDHFYANPSDAQTAAEILGFYPTFIRILAEEARREKHTLSDTLKELLFATATTVKEPDPQNAVKNVSSLDRIKAALHLNGDHPDDVEHRLLGDPVSVVEAAKQLKVAVPFALLLNLELDEIALSRRLRNAPDEEAALTQLREELDRINQALEQRARTDESANVMPTPDAGERFESWALALNERKREITRSLQEILSVQRKERTKTDSSTPDHSAAATGEAAASQSTTQTATLASRFRYSLRRASEANLLGLAFSGGGIRSATFNLGVLQALAEMDLLRKVDYLSTVSGGGYIASWLASWIKRQPPEGIRSVQRFLSPSRSPNPEADCVRPIRHLREYSNHVAPTPGFFSADTWTMIAIWLRNTVLNQAVLVLFLAALLMLPRGLFPWLFQLPTAYLIKVAVILFALACWSIGFNLGSFDREFWERNNLAEPNDPPSIRQEGNIVRTQQGLIQVSIVIPLFLSAFFFSSALVRWTPPLKPALVSGWRFEWVVGIAIAILLLAAQVYVHWREKYFRRFYVTNNPPRGWRLAAAIVVLVTVVIVSSLLGGLLVLAASRIVAAPVDISASGLAAWKAVLFGPDEAVVRLSRNWRIGISAAVMLFAAQMFVQWRGRYYRCFYEHANQPRGWQLLKAASVLLVIPLISSALGGLLIVNLGELISPTMGGVPATSAQEWRAIVFGPPAFVFVLSLVIVLQVGLLGRNFPDERREWWGRLGAWFSIYMLAWLLLFAIPIYGPLLLMRAGLWIKTAAALTWISATIGGVFAAKSPKTGVAADGALKNSTVRNIVSLVAPYVFIVGLLIVVATGAHLIFLRLDAPGFLTSHSIWDFAALEACYWALTTPTSFLGPLILSGLVLLVSVVLAWRVGVNEFSMHHFYCNRLVRAYLGASRPPGGRQPNRFTGFDLDDDTPLSEMVVAAETRYVGPYPILNSALNFVKSDDLAFQERKARSFVFTPLYCGYEFVDRRREAKWNSKLTRDGYRPTSTYAYSTGKGIHIGTAAAISGAAVNPNMGHHSSPSAAFLLTMFNARLGWWLGNPRHASTWQSSSPGLGLLYLLKELTAYTNDHSGFVNLSDGGHFDNLGVYELIRRRCRYVIVSDAEQDVDLNFGSLGNVIRKCRTDFGVDIDIRLDRIHRVTSSTYSEVHCVVGSIRYPDETRGTLLYMKSSLTGDEPADVLEYRSRQPAFPQQSTADQLFDESQFESYRALGYHVAQSTFRRAVDAAQAVAIEELFMQLEKHWYPPAPSGYSNSAKHISAYEALLERVRLDNRLSMFDGVFFPALPAALGTPPSAEQRDAFYTCTAMLDLMQTVYIDLDLDENAAHPHNAGWIQIFHQWASKSVLQNAWAITKETYSERFRRFCERQLQLPY